jgi:hypothetical protein
MSTANWETSFKNTGAVDPDRPERKSNVAPLKEIRGEEQGTYELKRDTNADTSNDLEPEDDEVNQDPGEQQKRNQGEKEEDDLAA